MKAITLQSPYALAIGIFKHYETRRTRLLHSVLGQRIAIHCGKQTTMLEELRRGLITTPQNENAALIERELNERCASLLDDDWEVHRGCIVATALVWEELFIQEREIERQSPNERAWGWWYSGYWAYQLTNVKFCHPVPARGNVGLWTWNGEIVS